MSASHTTWNGTNVFISLRDVARPCSNIFNGDDRPPTAQIPSSSSGLHTQQTCCWLATLEMVCPLGMEVSPPADLLGP
eukprot:1156184-Pelagomonas_calceolata.AAC.19